MTSSTAPRPVPPDERCVDHAIRGRCSAREIDRVLSDLAARQHGVVARWQLLGAGMNRRTIDDRIGRRLHPVHRGVYSVGYPISRTESRWMAVVLAAGPDAVLSHRSAAQLLGLVPRASHVHEITRPTYLRRHPCIRGHRSLLSDDERTLVAGIPVTTVPRTVLDLAAVAPRRQVERAMAEIEVRGLADRLSIPDLLERYPRRRGSAVVRSLLEEGALGYGVTQNDFEESLVPILDAHGIQRPHFNANVAVPGRFYRVDCLWRAERLIVELDGRAAHGTPNAFEEDRERDRLLLIEGWRVMRVTWRQLRHRPASIAADVRKALIQGRALR